MKHHLGREGTLRVKTKPRRRVSTGVIGGIFGVILLGVVGYLSLQFDQHTCEVCVEFRGRTQCRTASGADKKTAIQTAQSNACAFVISSKTDGFLCDQTPPTRVTCQEP